MRIRIRFEKEGNVRFLGHLDVMRYFQKAMARARIAVCYSSGFHPHPILSFALPLGVGLTSKGEYMDLEVEENGLPRDMKERLNAVMAEGFRVTGIRRLPEESRRHNNAMATVGMAEYRVRLKGLSGSDRKDSASERIDAYLAEPQIILTKKTKKGESQVNIRPFIYDLHYEPETESFFLRLSAGSQMNLRPETVLSGLLGRECARGDLSICRLDLLTAEGVSLGKMGEEIS